MFLSVDLNGHTIAFKMKVTLQAFSSSGGNIHMKRLRCELLLLAVLCFGTSAQTQTTSANTSPIDAMFGLKLGAPLPKNVVIVKPLKYHEVTVVPPAKMQTFPQCVVILNTNDTLIAAIESTGILDDEENALRIFNTLSFNFSKQCGNPAVPLNLTMNKLHKWEKESHLLTLGLRESADALLGKKSKFWIDVELADSTLEPPKDDDARDREMERKTRKTP
jgi:hypothetical protein